MALFLGQFPVSKKEGLQNHLRPSLTPAEFLEHSSCMTEQTPLIELRRLTKVYQEGERLHPVLREVSIPIQRGEFVVLLGRSGSGKSTKKTSSSRPLRTSSGGSADMSLEVATINTAF